MTVTMIPALGEFTCATVPVRKTSGSGGTTVAENLKAITETADIVVVLDRLQSMAPAVESASLVVAWSGDDLRAGNCKVQPGVELDTKATTPSAWIVNGIGRADAFLVNRDAENRPVYAGTPADFAVLQAIQEMKAPGLRVPVCPFVLMDAPSPQPCSRHQVVQSGTAQSRSANFCRMATIPPRHGLSNQWRSHGSICRNGRLNGTFIVKQNWMA